MIWRKLTANYTTSALTICCDPPRTFCDTPSTFCDPPSTFCDPPSILKLDGFLRNHWFSIGVVDDLEKAHCELHYKLTHEFQERHLLADCFKTNGNQ